MSTPYYFQPGDMKYLSHLAERIAKDVEWYDARLVVAVYDKADSQPVAWIECHPTDSDPTIRFAEEEK